VGQKGIKPFRLPPAFSQEETGEGMDESVLQQKQCYLPRLIVVTLLFSLMLGMAAGNHSYAQSGEASSARITLQAPAQVRLGEVITLRLRLHGDLQVAGFEAQLLYAQGVAEFAAFSPPPAPEGYANGQLIVPQMGVGSAVGYFTCSTGPCRSRQQSQPTVEAENFGVVEVLPLAAGTLEIRLAHVQVVDSSGRPLAITVAQPSVVVQVGEGGELHSAPVPEPVSASDQVANIHSADITMDGAVTHGDVMEVAMAWQSVREAGEPCSALEASADINGDGCVTVADVQAAAGQGTAAGNGEIAQAAAGTTYTVDSTLDEHDSDLDDGLCQSASNVCTLRAAIQQANVNPGSDLILFALPGSDVHTIQLSQRLPALSDLTGGTTIDGYSLAGAAPNTDQLVSNAQIRIQIRGNGYDAFDGLPITSAGNVVTGLSFFNLKRSLWIYGSGASENVIIGNFIGTDAAGTFAAEAESDLDAHGVHVEKGASANRIGGVTPAERNVVSGNARHGIGVWHFGTNENLVIGNLVGLSPDGLHRVANGQQGVDINFGASFNIVGGSQPGERNVISGNGENGAEITHTEQTKENVIEGNFFGTDVTGESAPAYAANGGVGISLHDRIMNNLVVGNVIGNNEDGGILIDSWGNCCTANNRIENNRIGVTPGGQPIGNGVFGIHIAAPSSQIGPGNVVAYNATGIRVDGEGNDGNTITQNSIYSNAGLGIDLAPLGAVNNNDANDDDAGPNQQLNFPELTVVSPTFAGGTACGGCVVEIFIADESVENFGEGKTFVGSGTAADDGTFTVELENVKYGDFLTATATDANGSTSEFSRNAPVVNPSNQLPVAVDDAATTKSGIAVQIDVLDNDSDPDGDSLMVEAVGAAANGSLTTNGTAVVYTPTVDFVGTDSFTYTVSDGNGGNGVASVAVAVEDDTSGTGSPGVGIHPGEVTLDAGGPPATYTVVLESKPSAVVTVTMTTAAPLVVMPQGLVFTPDNWETPQVVTVSAANEEGASSAEVGEILHNVHSADSLYDGLEAPAIGVNLNFVIDQTPEIFLPSIQR
jgi:CSLREA domain-containing protein